MIKDKQHKIHKHSNIRGEWYFIITLLCCFLLNIRATFHRIRSHLRCCLLGTCQCRLISHIQSGRSIILRASSAWTYELSSLTFLCSLTYKSLPLILHSNYHYYLSLCSILAWFYSQEASLYLLGIYIFVENVV